MPLKLDDGYTLKGQTTGKNNDGEPLDVIKFEYRPPRASEMAEFRFRIQTAPSGEEQHKIRCAFILARLVSWDVQGTDGKPRPPAQEWLDMMADPFILDLVNESAKWKPRPQAEAVKNS